MPGANVFQWLSTIQSVRTYEELGSLFVVPGTESKGHDSAYNFDNLYPDAREGRHLENLTNTIEFRQHEGTFDLLAIVAWVELVAAIVQFATGHTVDDDCGLIRLLSQSGNLNLELPQFFEAIGYPSYEAFENLERVKTSAGTPWFGLNDNPTSPTLAAIIEQNEYEHEQRANVDLLRVGGDWKVAHGYYGIRPGGACSVVTEETLQWIINCAKIDCANDTQWEVLSCAERELEQDPTLLVLMAMAAICAGARPSIIHGKFDMDNFQLRKDLLAVHNGRVVALPRRPVGHC